MFSRVRWRFIVFNCEGIKVSLTDGLEIIVRFTSKSVADGEDLHLVAGTRIKILENYVRFSC